MAFSARLNGLATTFVACLAASTGLNGQAQAVELWPKAVVQRVSELYGIGEIAATDRLASEAKAADLYRIVEGFRIEGYAGSWYDAQSGQLIVAINEAGDEALVRRLGASPTVVRYSLDDLEQAKEWGLNEIEQALSLNAIRHYYVDYLRNAAVIGVATEYLDQALALVLPTSKPLLIEQAEPRAFRFTSGPVHAASGTRNVDIGWSPCSVGASVNGGFITAGHCGYVNETVYSPDFVPMKELGIFKGSTFPSFSPNFHDSAWVQTTVGWTPEPKIDGYSSGTLSVPAAWSGIGQVPVGSTVCRYGQTSGGPHCGTVNQLNFPLDVNPNGFTQYVINTTRVAGACSNDGDSGGPYVAASNGQLQGTNIGGDPVNTCPTPATYVYFQPFPIHLTYWADRRILTTHGATAPTVPGVICPNMGSSGSGLYMCEFGHYNSQGTTTVSWTSSTSDTSSGPKLSGSCTPGYPVNVWLTITNPYGSYNYSKTFTCPTTIIP